MKKHILTLAVAAAMVGAVATGCSSAEKAGGSDSTMTDSAATTTTPATTTDTAGTRTTTTDTARTTTDTTKTPPTR